MFCVQFLAGVEKPPNICSPEARGRKYFFFDTANKTEIKLICNNKFICWKAKEILKLSKEGKADDLDVEKVEKNQACVLYHSDKTLYYVITYLATIKIHKFMPCKT